MSGYNVAVLGATGMVGQEMLATLSRRKFPVKDIKLLASARSAGGTQSWEDREYPVELAEPAAFRGVDLVLSSAGEAVSRELAPAAVEAGAVVVDNTAEFRMRDDVPLVIPEINAEACRQHRGIIANPNCSTAVVLMPLAPLRALGKLERVVVATYQSTSGAGKEAVVEMEEQIHMQMHGKEVPPAVFRKPIAFNLIPAIGSFREDLYTSEEVKMTFESRKIMGIPDLAVTCTCVRVPVRVGHSAAVNVVFDRPVSLEDVRAILAQAPGVRILDDPASHLYPTPLECAGEDDVLVGRIRGDLSHPNGVNFWVAGDNLRKGAALNAVQIAEVLVRDGLLKPAAVRPVPS
ncbi:MAG: aspartate-semialdehyde dehydrogenase [Candidatus Sericytochromatia bacterium]|nr:aspartate-semialdehyde dehydrogenase [Candidatus Tanganyikabacteria bacterium]